MAKYDATWQLVMERPVPERLLDALAKTAAGPHPKMPQDIRRRRPVTSRRLRRRPRNLG